MLWPFVRRVELQLTRELLRDAVKKKKTLRGRLKLSRENEAALSEEVRETRAALREAEDRATVAESAADVLRHQLDRSEQERTQINLKLIRAGFGINPFYDELQGNMPAAPDPIAPEAASPYEIPAGADHEQVRKTFVQEAVGRFGNNVPKVARFVEQRMEEYYRHRPAPVVLSPAEIALRDRVAAELEAALVEGAAKAAEQAAKE